MVKNFVYERYNYSFLDKKELFPISEWTEDKSHPYYNMELNDILNQFIGCVNDEATRERVKFAIQTWANVNNLEVRIENLEFE